MNLLSLVPLLGKVLDSIFPDKQAADAAKLKVLELAASERASELDAELRELSARAEIVKTEAASENWLASSWRPLLMLTFGALIVARWFGWSAPDLAEAEYIKLWDIVQLGLGGYVIGRSAEKIIPSVADAIKNR